MSAGAGREEAGTARTVLVVGIGAGNPDFVTVQAIKALNRADVVFLPDKGAEKAGLRALRAEILDRYLEHDRARRIDVVVPPRGAGGAAGGAASGAGGEGDYRRGVDAWHARLEGAYERLFATEIPPGGSGALLVWGDPGLYDSTLRIVARIAARDPALAYEVVPGISAAQALAAAHKVPLNAIGEPVVITPARRLGAVPPAGEGSVVVVLDGEEAFLRPQAEDAEIYWGAYLGTPDERLVAGRLAEVAEAIADVRRRARAGTGWIMDTYLMRRRGG